MANELAKIEQIVGSKEMQRQFRLALPKHFSAERFARIAITAITKTPKLLQCTKESLISCLLDLSQLGLEPDNRKAHLIPYGDKCTLIVDYKGLVELARRSKEISNIHADVVCANDLFEYSFGSSGALTHKPALKDRGDVIAAYSFVLLKDGSSSYEVMNKEEIELIHRRSKAADDGPWKTDWKEMAKKTVFRRHTKWLPVSSETFQKLNEKDYDVPIDIETQPPVIEQPQEIQPQEETKPATEEKKKEEKEPQQEQLFSAIPYSEGSYLANHPISPKQAGRLYAIASGNGWTEKQVKDFLAEQFGGIDSAEKLDRDDYDAVVKWTQENKPKVIK